MFQVLKPKPKIKIKKTKKRKEKKIMNLTLGTWVLIIIVMVVVAKVAHKLSLKTIFKPTKKAAKSIKKEWDES